MARAIPDFIFEQEYLKTHEHVFLIGVDEAGRGPLAGPVVAAAAWYKDNTFAVPSEFEKDFLLIRDSKALSEKQREKVFDLIQKYFEVGVGIVHPETIDRINILEATFLAMKEAVADIKRKTKALDQELHLLIDGNQKLPHFSIQQECVVSGDKLVKTIAAASIVAKVTRDRMMDGYDKEYPQYGFAKHKGYGTKQHMEALERFGPTPIHRTSFAPVHQAVIRFKELGIIAV